ncbi:MAG: hypothetical protein ACKVQU_35950 [Burkholderiales bacterium]
MNKVRIGAALIILSSIFVGGCAVYPVGPGIYVAPTPIYAAPSYGHHGHSGWRHHGHRGRW